MKKLVYLLTFLFVGTIYAQVTDQPTQSNRDNMDMRTDRATYYDIQEPSDYTFNNQNFRFTPNDRGDLTVSQIENGTETEIGNLRRTTANGYYIMTSTSDPNDVSFGRFDEQGNFRTYRYDSTTDSVLEEDYNISTPRNIRGQNQSDMRRNNPNRNLNNQGVNNRNTNNRGVNNRNTTTNDPIDNK
ncbi:hypothetical protein FHG64_18995 [Antarcticibacterium flavum]|uniref:RHS repeat-associated core domain-containing protein n=1 Tax=Antarcticibacterium flavum TaxID=2058175 RepID=A0A5B7WZT9_9FLAO|nr:MULTISPECIES: hypothetical protein [Antarcticibacterium]MCM4160308.1 hypothetical protein [Antarcticibacterium sp. W02-3]QCY67918.1 hypothetical protein FHG64_00080 [Antarcticibacterium flavum]QCY71311.1 hypothetical protein FHG64_18995 [Antarcticibacterium flavum]